MVYAIGQGSHSGEYATEMAYWETNKVRLVREFPDKYLMIRGEDVDVMETIEDWMVSTGDTAAEHTGLVCFTGGQGPVWLYGAGRAFWEVSEGVHPVGGGPGIRLVIAGETVDVGMLMAGHMGKLGKFGGEKQPTEGVGTPGHDQLKLYHEMREELERDYFGRWVIFDQGKVLEHFESYNEAWAFVIDKGLDWTACLVKRVGYGTNRMLLDA